MENTEKFVIPDMSKPEEKPKKRNNLAEYQKQKRAQIAQENRLPRQNRTLNCIYCDCERILNPDQYQSYFDYWDDEEKIKRNFVCKPCDVFSKENPFQFFLIYSEQTRKLIKATKAAFELYRENGNGQQLLTTIFNLYKENKLFRGENFNDNCELIIDKYPKGIKIHGFPFIGAFEILPYESEKKNKIKFL